MIDNKASYREITKAIGLFGGVKVFQIVINLIKNKILAVLLGPYGMGVVGMITSTTALVSSLTNMGLRTSSVRDVSKAYSNGSNYALAEIVTILRKLVWFTGLVGTLIILLFAKQFSIWAFDSSAYAVYFRIVSIILLLDQLSVGQIVLLQGTFHYKYIAKASLYGSTVGLITTIPLYYIWEINAIAPALVFSSVIHLLFTSLYSRKIEIPKVALSVKQLLKKGSVMIKMGFVIALSGITGSTSIYIQRILLSNIGSIEDVGLYTAGLGIATQYINIIFTSISSDYSPRLSAVSHNKDEFILAINRQMKMLVTIIAPLILFFIVFIREITILLYSDKFLPISCLLEWVMFGMFFRATSWSISYALIARGDAKPFFFNELVTNIFSVILSIIGYYYASFEGMGIGFCLSYILYTFQLYVVGKSLFQLRINKKVLLALLVQIIIVLFFFILLKLIGYIIWRYIVGLIGLGMIGFLTYYYLDEMIGMASIVNKILCKSKK